MPEVPSIRIDAAGSILVFSAYSEDWAWRTALQHRAPSPEVHLERKAVIGAAAAKAHFGPHSGPLCKAQQRSAS